MKVHLIFLLVLIVVGALGVEQAAAQTAMDGVVIITTFLDGGKSGFGTGAVISANGDILTAYHVIQGAKHITVNVYSNSEPFNDVTVAKWDPNQDLAIIHINRLKSPLRALQIADSAYSVQPTNAQVLGHSASLYYQTIPAAITGPCLPSEQFRDPNSHQKIFALNGICIIPLVVTVFNGLSGGPLVVQGKIVGVLSGSFLQGGSIGWALPVTRSIVAQMPVVDRETAAVVWKNLDLMNPNIKMLRAEISLGQRLARGLDKLTELLSQAKPILTNAENLCTIEKRYLRGLLDEMDAQIQRSSNIPVESFFANSNLSPSWAKVQETSATCNAAIAAHTLLSNQLSVVGQEVNAASFAFATSMPDTPANQKVDEEMARDGEANLILAQREQADARLLGSGIDAAIAAAPNSLTETRTFWALMLEKMNMIVPQTGLGMFRREYENDNQLYSGLEKFFRLQE